MSPSLALMNPPRGSGCWRRGIASSVSVQRSDDDPRGIDVEAQAIARESVYFRKKDVELLQRLVAKVKVHEAASAKKAAETSAASTETAIKLDHDATALAEYDSESRKALRVIVAKYNMSTADIDALVNWRDEYIYHGYELTHDNEYHSAS